MPISIQQAQDVPGPAVLGKITTEDKEEDQEEEKEEEDCEGEYEEHHKDKDGVDGEFEEDSDLDFEYDSLLSDYRVFDSDFV